MWMNKAIYSDQIITKSSQVSHEMLWTDECHHTCSNEVNWWKITSLEAKE
ncbi:hypothetical protein HanIR_Chr02g0052551 [Helianthus annuus]|nr:hypothetical protein HanIR_Chr02g0052551 [Helianthus annuus]